MYLHIWDCKYKLRKNSNDHIFLSIQVQINKIYHFLHVVYSLSI